MPFAKMRPTTGYCEHFENGIKILKTMFEYKIYVLFIIFA